MTIGNSKKPLVGLFVEGDVGYYYRRNDPFPFMMDRRFIVGADKVFVSKKSDVEVKQGLRAGQEFYQPWDGMPIIKRDGANTNLKRLIMEEKGIPSILVNRVVTKYIDGNRRNVTSDNIVMAEPVYFNDLVCSGGKYEFYQVHSRMTNQRIVVKKEELMDYFNSYCEQLRNHEKSSHPMILSLSGVLIAKKDC